LYSNISRLVFSLAKFPSGAAGIALRVDLFFLKNITTGENTSVDWRRIVTWPEITLPQKGFAKSVSIRGLSDLAQRSAVLSHRSYV